MNGIAAALAAGTLFGVFQTMNRRSNQLLDAYRATFLTLLVGLVVLGAWVAVTEDLTVLAEAPWTAHAAFAAAGIVHFVIGWTLLGLSQQRVGAARTSAVVAAQPLFATFLAALALAEPLTVAMVAGVLVVTAGLVALSTTPGTAPGSAGTPWLGLGAALALGASPLLIRAGLDRLPAPLVGVSVALLAAALVYGAALLLTRRRRDGTVPGGALRWLLGAGIAVAAAIALQWTAYDLITIAVAVTLLQVATPVVLIAAPVVVGTPAERITPMLVLGAAAVIVGSTVVLLAGR